MVLESEQLLVATGRKPNTETLNLDKADVKIGSHNEIIINSYFAHEYYSMNLKNSIFDRNQLSLIHKPRYFFVDEGSVSKKESINYSS